MNRFWKEAPIILYSIETYLELGDIEDPIK